MLRRDPQYCLSHPERTARPNPRRNKDYGRSMPREVGGSTPRGDDTVRTGVSVALPSHRSRVGSVSDLGQRSTWPSWDWFRRTIRLPIKIAGVQLESGMGYLRNPLTVVPYRCRTNGSPNLSECRRKGAQINKAPCSALPFTGIVGSHLCLALRDP